MTLTRGKKILFAIFGIMLVSFGVAFNAGALFGNDPVGILYDGMRSALGFSADKLGFVSNLVNYSLIIILLVIGRKYLNIGTVIYILPYGTFVSLGTTIYHAVFSQDIFLSRVAATVFGCAFIYIGVGIYIAMDIGLDPFTAVVMVINDKLKWQFRWTKICFDVVMIIIGTLLGGKLGLITFITALTAGPCIQASGNFVKKRINE